MNIELISKNFISLFETDFGNSNVTKLQNLLVGVSIKKNYPENLIKKLRIKDDKKYLSLINVIIEDENILNSNLKRKPVFIRIDFILELNNQYKYDYEFVGNNNLFPINIISSEDYFYHIEENQFYKLNKIISPKIMIEELFNKHIKTSKKIVGFPLRTKLLFWRKLFPALINFISNIFVILAYLLYGLKNPLDVQKRYYKEAFKENSNTTINSIIDPKQQEKILFLGYNISKWSLASYCSIILLVYLFFFYFNFKPLILVNIMGNNFLLLAFVTLSLTIYDLGISKLFKYLIAKSSKYFIEIKFKNIKI